MGVRRNPKTKFIKADIGKVFRVKHEGNEIKVKIFYISGDEVKLFNIFTNRAMKFISNKFDQIYDEAGQPIYNERRISIN